MREVVIVQALRTPIAKFRGELAQLPVPDLGALVLRGLVEKTGLDPAMLDEVILGNLLGQDWGNPARASLLAAGFPLSVPGLTVDRQCASSLNAVALAAGMIATGAADIVIAGGVESYSQQPHLIARTAAPYPANLTVLDYKPSIPGFGHDVSMIKTAENVARRYGISRQACDAVALQSHQKADVAWRSGWFDEQVLPISRKGKKGEVTVFDRDTSPRPDSSMEQLSKLSPILGPDGVVTAGNASPQNDGASAILMMSAQKAEELGYRPLAYIKEYASAGCDPLYMGLGPIYSTRKLMARAGYTMDDFDLVEINEAFAAQVLPCVQELGIDEEKLNVEGGAIAIGHPLAASGGVVLARMVYALRRRGLHRGLVTFCCGGGQGFSLVVENADR